MMEKSDGARASILPWASLATLAATAIVVATAPIIADRLLDPDFCRRLGPDATFVEGVTAFVAPVLLAFLTWLVFYIFVFRPRGPLWKALIVLPMMAFVAVAVGLIAHLSFYAPGLERQAAQVRAWQAREHEAVHAIRGRLRADLGGDLERGLPQVQSPDDVVEQLSRIRKSRVRIKAYEQEMFGHLAAAQSDLMHLRVLEGTKEQALAYYQRLLAPTSDTRRHFQLTYQVLDQQEAILELLRSHPGGWFALRRRLVFNDLGVLARVEETARGLEDTIDELNRLEGSMRIGADPEWLGPPGRQGSTQ